MFFTRCKSAWPKYSKLPYLCGESGVGCQIHLKDMAALSILTQILIEFSKNS